jgi:putative spermidine/putrescine transport system permease protein
MQEGKRPASFYALAAVFALFVLFLYGPMFTIFVLSFQGPEGGLTFPMRGVSFHWFGKLWEGMGVVDIAAAFRRSVALGTVVMLFTVLLSLGAGLAFRKKSKGSGLLFYTSVASLIMPSIVVSLGIGLQFRLIDTVFKSTLETLGLGSLLEGYGTAMGLYTSALGAHLTWTLPFGLLIMLAVFNRFNPAYEEAADDLGATPWQSFRHVVLPLIAPSLVGVGMFGFTPHQHRHHAGDLCAGHGDDGGVVCGDGRHAAAHQAAQAPARARLMPRVTIPHAQTAQDPRCPA